MTVEIPLGWRRLRDNELPILGDKFFNKKENKFYRVLAGEVYGPQIDDCKPYIGELGHEWMPHDGGDMPVNPNEIVDICFHGTGDPRVGGAGKAHNWSEAWTKGWIKHYRLHKATVEKEPMKNLDKNGVDLNEWEPLPKDGGINKEGDVYWSSIRKGLRQVNPGGSRYDVLDYYRPRKSKPTLEKPSREQPYSLEETLILVISKGTTEQLRVCSQTEDIAIVDNNGGKAVSFPREIIPSLITALEKMK